MLAILMGANLGVKEFSVLIRELLFDIAHVCGS